MIDLSAYPTHADLLDQVADSTEERDAVRRILGRDPLAEHELDTLERHKRAAVYPIRFGACASGPCEQGRKLCPSPEACQISTTADAARPPMRRGDLRGLLLLALASWGVVATAVAVALYAMGVRL